MQVESSLGSFTSPTSGKAPECRRPSRASLLEGSAAQLLLQEEGGEEADLIFGLGAQLDGLLPCC